MAHSDIQALYDQAMEIVSYTYNGMTTHIPAGLTQIFKAEINGYTVGLTLAETFKRSSTGKKHYTEVWYLNDKRTAKTKVLESIK